MQYAVRRNVNEAVEWRNLVLDAVVTLLRRSGMRRDMRFDVAPWTSQTPELSGNVSVFAISRGIRRVDGSQSVPYILPYIL